MRRQRLQEPTEQEVRNADRALRRRLGILEDRRWGAICAGPELSEHGAWIAREIEAVEAALACLARRMGWRITATGGRV